MRFLLDQDVYALTERLLRGLGHDVVTASELGMARSNDLGILGRAGTDSRILVTRALTAHHPRHKLADVKPGFLYQFRQKPKSENVEATS